MPMETKMTVVGDDNVVYPAKYQVPEYIIARMRKSAERARKIRTGDFHPVRNITAHQHGALYEMKHAVERLNIVLVKGGEQMDMF